MRCCLLLTLAAIGGLALAAPAGADHGAADLAMNMRHVANAPTPPQFEAGPEALDFNSDLAFWGDFAFAGNYNGFRIIDISRPRRPRDVSVVECRGPQNDVGVWGRRKNRPELLFLGVDAVRGRNCAPAPPFDFEGVRIFDVSNPRAPEHITDVDVECGAHTFTLVYDEQARTPAMIHLYVPSSISSSAPGARSRCPGSTNPVRHQQISIVDVPVDNPENAVARPYPIHDDTLPTVFNPVIQGCHDHQAFLELDIVAASCNGEGQLWDISDPANPCTTNPSCHTHVRNPNFVFFHNAVFTWDGEVVGFTDEWGGGSAHGCDGPQDTRGNTYFYDVVQPGQPIGPPIERYMIARPQPPDEECTTHNGMFIPVEDRYLYVAAWYKGGTSVGDISNPNGPADSAPEVAFFDAQGVDGNSKADTWSSYWYNDFIYANDGLRFRPLRGFDVFRLTGRPGRLARDAEDFDYLNPQTQEEVLDGDEDDDDEDDEDDGDDDDDDGDDDDDDDAGGDD
jgi:LVIVD repeat